jgi:hypothetical protein
MLKKYMISGSVALLLAALLTLVGCAQATDSHGSGGLTLSENHLFGTATGADVARAVASAKNSGRAVVLTDGLTISGAAGAAEQPDVADFKDLPVRVEGSVTVTGNVIVNGAFANLSFVETEGVSSRITVANGGAFIYSGVQDNIYTSSAPVGFKVKYVANPNEAAQGTDARIAVPSYAVGVTTVAPHVTHLYVVDKVTVDAFSPIPDVGVTPNKPNVIALGDVDLTESNSAAFGTVGTTFIFARSAVLTSSAAAPVTLGLPASATVALPTIAARTQSIIVSAGTAFTSLTINKIEGPQTVTLTTPTITALTIGEAAPQAKVAVNGTTVITATTITKNEGDISLEGATITGGTITITANSGAIAVSTPTLADAVAITDNNGTIALNSSATTTGAIGVTGSNAGTIIVNTPAMASVVTVAANSGTLTFDAPSEIATTAIITVSRNTESGNINFAKPVTSLLASGLKAPNNYGAVNFLGDVTALANLGSADTAADKIAGTGKVVFGGTATFTAGPVVIDCDTEFTGAVTRTNGILTINGDITLPNEGTITLNNTAIFTLGAGKRILIAGAETTPVLAAGSAVAITPVTGVILKAGRALVAGDDDPLEVWDDRTIFVNNADITTFSGNLRVLPGGFLNINTGGILATTGSLTLEEGAALAFPEGGAKSVALGNTTIAGTVLSQVSAAGGAVTFSPNKISGTPGSSLVFGEDYGAVSITAATTATNLLIEGVNVDLSLNGSLVINEASTTAVKVTLVGSTTNPGRITLDTASLSSTITRAFTDNVIATNGKLNGSGVLRADDVSGTVTVGDLSGGMGSSLSISGPLGAGSDKTILAAGVSVTL